MGGYALLHYHFESKIKPHHSTRLQAKLTLNLLPPLLPLHLLPNLLHLLRHSLFALFALSLLIQCPPLHDARNNLGRVYILKLVVFNLAVDVEGLGDGVGVEGEWHKGGFAVVYGDGFRVRKRVEEGFAEGEGGAEDDGVDVLGVFVSRVRV